MNQLRLNAFQIKIIALTIMTIDHIGAFQVLTADPTWNAYLRMIGRIAAPLFLYMVAEGLHHTRSKPRYILRLYLVGVLVASMNLNVTVFHGSMMPSHFGNICPTLFYVAFYVYCLEILLWNHPASVSPESRKSAIASCLAICGLVVPLLWAGLDVFLTENGYGAVSTLLNMVYRQNREG